MLLVFTFSIMPKRYVHDIFDAHKDTPVKLVADQEAHIVKSGMACDCHSLVATSPFVEVASEIRINTLVSPFIHPATIVIILPSTPIHFQDGRGPPSLV